MGHYMNIHTAGLSSTLTEQLQKILEVVGTGLKGVTSFRRSAMRHKLDRRRRIAEQEKADASRRERIRRGIWHDGRVDCVAGNGVMSELGMGVERMTEADMEMEKAGEAEYTDMVQEENATEARRKQKSEEDIQAVISLPVVVVKNYAAKSGTPSSHHQHELLDVLAHWAAGIAENQVSVDGLSAVTLLKDHLCRSHMSSSLVTIVKTPNGLRGVFVAHLLPVVY